MIRLNVTFPLQPLPRERIARNGGTFKSKEYLQYAHSLSSLIDRFLVSKAYDCPVYLGLFNAYVPRYQNSDPSDLDNIWKGILDTLVWTERIPNDNRTIVVGYKCRCFAYSQDYSVILLGTELEELEVDKTVNYLLNQARLKVLR